MPGRAIADVTQGLHHIDEGVHHRRDDDEDRERGQIQG